MRISRARIAPHALTAAILLAVPASATAGDGAKHHMRGAMFVANAEGGTVSVVNARRLRVVREIDVLPDGPDATLGEDDPLQAAIEQRLVEAAGGKNYAQDQDVSPDGRVLYVSRGHRGDVAAFRIRTGTMLWKLPVGGMRADHMEISEDGNRLYVSALTANVVDVIDTEERAVIGSFATGDWPHDNHLSHDGERLYNGSIGNILVPSEARAAYPGSYQLTVVDPDTLIPLATHEFDAGIRPFVITEDERRLYAQLSLYHGLIEFNLDRGVESRRLELPIDEGVSEDDYDFEAPHHGLALSASERTLCAAGRASDYVALVSTRRMRARAIIEVGDAPGWATSSPNGRRCFVTNTREDTLSAISYRRAREVARIRVGDGPKHIEAARIPARVLWGAD